MRVAPQFNIFFKTLTSGDCDLFECAEDAEHPTYLPTKEPLPPSGEEGNGADAGDDFGFGGDGLLDAYEAIGRVIGKAILEEIPVPARFHPCLFRVLLRGSDFQPNLHELEAFSPTEARSCRQVSRGTRQ